MAEFRIALGGALNVVTPDELSEALTGLQGHIDKSMRRSSVRPIRRTISGSANVTLTNGQTQVVQLGVPKPGMGRIWGVSRVTVIGGDDHSSPANLTAAVYIGDSATPMLGSVVVPGQILPYFQTFSRHSVWVHDTEELYVNLAASGNVTAQNVVVNVSVNEFWDDTIDQQYA